MKRSLIALATLAAAGLSFARSTAEKAHDKLFDYMSDAGLILHAVVTSKSTTIANRDAVPAVINDGRLERSTLESATGYAAVAVADSITSYYPICSVPSSAIVRGVFATCPAGMTAFAGNVGVFKNTRDSGGVALGTVANAGSGTFFASAQSFAAALNRQDITNQSGNYPASKREQPLWQAIGLASDPNTTFDIGVTCTTANTGAAGGLALDVQYADNSN